MPRILAERTDSVTTHINFESYENLGFLISFDEQNPILLLNRIFISEQKGQRIC